MIVVVVVVVVAVVVVFVAVGSLKLVVAVASTSVCPGRSVPAGGAPAPLTECAVALVEAVLAVLPQPSSTRIAGPEALHEKFGLEGTQAVAGRCRGT